MKCANCEHNDGMVYTSTPPKYRCTITNEFHLGGDDCNVEFAPVKHGRWIKNEDRSGWHCSCCGKDDLYAYPYTENNERELQDFYCPNCGADMREMEE